METQNTFATILENESVTVSALLCAETLKIKVKVNDETNEHFGQTFVTEITEEQRNESLNDYFENLNEVLQFMELEERAIKIDLQKEIMSLFEITRLKKQRLIFTSQLIKEEIQIKEKNEEFSEVQQHLQDISNRCLEKREIENDQIKKYFEIIANELITLKKQKANQKELNEIKNEFQSKTQRKNEESQEVLTGFSEISEKVFELQKQISLKSNENEKIQQQIEEAQKINENLSQRLKIKQQETFREFTDKICELQKQISLQNEKIETLEIKIKEKSEKITENSEKIQKLSLLENSLFLKSENVKYLNNIVKEEIQKQQKKQKEQKLQILKKQKQKQIEKQISFMQKCKNQKHSIEYNFDGKTLIKRNNLDPIVFFVILSRLSRPSRPSKFNFFTFFEQIVFDVQFIFHVKIIQKKKQIFIGVIDYEDYAQNIENENNYVCYYSDGYKLPKKINQGNGYKVNDTVTVAVNRNTKTIKYYVNNKLQTTDNAQFLGNTKTKIFPCASMWGTEDEIEFTF